MQSDTLETLFGGAAGGGKSHGQLLDALRFAVCYPGSRQLMLRRTMPPDWSARLYRRLCGCIRSAYETTR